MWIGTPDLMFSHSKVTSTFKLPTKRRGPHSKKFQVQRLCFPQVEAEFQAKLHEGLRDVADTHPGHQYMVTTQNSAPRDHGRDSLFLFLFF